MRAVFTVTILALMTPCSRGGNTPKNWHEFKKVYQKDFKPREDLVKHVIYQSNLQEIDDHNYAYRKGQATFKMAVNPLADMLNTDVKDKMNGFKMNLKNRKINFIGFDKIIKKNITLPDSVDWRNVSVQGCSVISPVIDQEMCASCYAISAVGAIESQLAITKKRRINNLSIQDIIDCSNTAGNFGCSGGLPDFAYEYMKTNPGVNSENYYPYTGEEGKCRHNKKNVAAKVKDWVILPKGNEAALKYVLATIGPIGVAIDASLPSFQLYSKGVYMDKHCKNKIPDHAMLLVGYGIENGLKYWLVKNSWGKEWGDQGYVKIIRDAGNHCGIATHATYPVL